MNDKKKLIVKMDNGEKWSVPFSVIASHRAEVYKHEFNDDLQKSLVEDTLPLFEDDYEVADWAKNNMDWVDVSDVATLVSTYNYQEAWLDSELEVL